MRAVIDTNGFLSAIPQKGKNKWLYHAFMDERFTWVVSNEIISEYSEIISEKFSENTANFVLSSLLSTINHQRFEPSFKWQLAEKNPDDNKLVDSAIGVNADYLVSDDKHIRNLLKIPNLFPPVPIVTFRQLKNILQFG